MPSSSETIQLYRRRFATNRTNQVESSAISHPLLLAAKSRLSVIRRFNFAGDDSRRILRIESSRQQSQSPCYFNSVFKTAFVAKNISRIINTVASIWRENMLGHLFLRAHRFPRAAGCRKTVRFSEQLMSADKCSNIFSRQIEAIVYLLRSRQTHEFVIVYCLPF